MFTHSSITAFTTPASMLVCVLLVVAWAFFFVPTSEHSSTNLGRRAVFAIFISLAGMLSAVVVFALVVDGVLGAP